MEIVKENTGEEPKKESKLLVVVGVDEISKQFLKEALVRILSMSGYSVNVQEFENKEETDFHVVDAKDFSTEMEAKASFVFGSYRNPAEVISWEHRLEPDAINKTNIQTMLGRFYELAKWMRSSKLAHCMDYDSPINVKGLHNYTNLRNLILPLTYAFQTRARAAGLEFPEPGKTYFDKINPKDLIESLVPELQEKSKEASDKFEETKKEKLGDGGATK